MQSAERELDVVVWGATGFTGRLVAEHLAERYGARGGLAWALGGRSEARLQGLRAELGCPDLPIVLGDSDDPASLAALAGRTRVVCTTVGPYARHGSGLVAVCAARGTHYCDLSGELPWIRRMIDAHEGAARASGARIVHCCGFDSIPSDLGVFFLQREMQARNGAACSRIKCRVKGLRGGLSGGTAASLLGVLAEAQADPAVRRLLADPYALNPEGRRGPDGPDRLAPARDADFDAWTAPFVMGALNTRVVRRTNALLGDAYGAGFRYDEAILTGPGPVGAARAAALTAALAAAMGAGAVAPLRDLLARLLPAPGEGPSRRKREAGYFDLRFFGENPADRGKGLRARVTGDRDPGYGSTARMLGESAACLARDELAVGGGFWTPASAMGLPLLTRLQANAGLDFAILAE